MCRPQASQGAALQCQLGNLYTASLYSGLASLLAQQGQQLAGKRVLCFSFGSGAVASMFTLTGRDCSSSSTAGDQQQHQQYSWSNAPCSLQAMADLVRQAVGCERRAWRWGFCMCQQLALTE
jgi:3-hydroxy-3-methylglutaryl CoA synthase